MIKVKYRPYKLTVTGHSTSAPLGEDLVCAGVSTLTTALAETLAEKAKILNVCAINLKEGDASIYVVPKKGHEHKINLIISTIMTGYRLMAETFPDYIQLDC